MITIDGNTLATVVDGRWRGEPPLQVSGVGTDTRELLTGRLFIAIAGERHDGHAHLDAAAEGGAVAAMVDAPPAGHDTARLPLLEVRNVRAALAALAAHHREGLSHTTVVGITGSAGKTTVRRMAEAVLSTTSRGSASPRSFNNDLGVPLTLLAASPEDRWLLVEIGTNRPGEIAALSALVRPHVAIITGTGRAHLEGFGSEEGVAKEKASLLDHLCPDGEAIVNVDRPAILPELAARASLVPCVVTYGRDSSADVQLTSREVTGDGQRIQVDGEWAVDVSLPGEHNAVNAVAVIELARRMGLNDADIARGLGRVAPAPMRMEQVDVGGMRIWNDAYNANPESMVAALRTFAEVEHGHGRLVAIVGEMLELGPRAIALHREVGEAMPGGIDVLIGVGDGGAAIVSGAVDAGYAGDTGLVSSRDALHEAANALQAGDRVLLKASRGVGLERVLEHLAEHHAATGGADIA
ncbi:MAG: UDP-N-acetylmuramoyl-tripeptide--D-alanyl-D-alanine ligase [Phycisphaerales bacterium]|nr:UDP-N-acetylmuramoyl-tripeptide--D-alanyl-D-alanine ligase [Phycisphaerales bacterium]